MNLQFKSNLSGTDVFKRVIVYLIGFIIAYAAYMALTIEGNFPMGATLLLYSLVMIGEFAISYVFTVALIEAVELGDQKFSWSGTMGKYLLINIKGLVLSTLTLGIYAAWYGKELMNYMVDNTVYPDKKITFNGKAVKILKNVVLGFVLPLIAIAAIFGVLLYQGGMNGSMGLIVLGYLIYIGGALVLVAIFTFVVYRWYIDLTFGTDTVSFSGELKEGALYFTKEFFLSCITIGIYGCAASVNIFRYFIDRIHLDGEEGKRVMKFTGTTGEGFKLVFVQILLTIITFGIYMPWAYAKCANWFVSNVLIEDYNELLAE